MQFHKIQILFTLSLALLSSSTNGLRVTHVTPNESSSSRTNEFAELDATKDNKDSDSVDLVKIVEDNVSPVTYKFYESLTQTLGNMKAHDEDESPIEVYATLHTIDKKTCALAEQ